MRVAISALCITLVARGLHAQGSYEIEVYGAGVVPVKSLTVEFHANYTFRGSEVAATGGRPPVIDDEWRPVFEQSAAVVACTPFFDRRGGLAPDARSIARAAAPCNSTSIANSYAAHGTIEAVTGLSSWSELGAYLFTNEQASPLVQVVGGSVRAKVRAPLDWKLPVGVALSAEAEYDDPRLSNDSWSLEIRPIVDKAIGRWYLSLNPTVERTLRGSGVANGIEFSPSAKASVDITPILTGGIEYYGAFGRIGAFAPPQSRLQQFFAAVDLHGSAQWEVNAGIGVGTTPATNHLVAKLILGRTLSWGQPSAQGGM